MEPAAYAPTVSGKSNSQLKPNTLLLIGGCFSLAFAVFQISAIWWPPDVMRYFGGPVTMQAARPGLYAAVCVVFGAVVGVCGLYALSGAGKISKLPLLRTVIGITTAVYLLRGLMVITIAMLIFKYPDKHLGRFLVFSMIALCVGLVHLGGAIRLFRSK